jgi:hypothetical protein
MAEHARLIAAAIALARSDVGVDAMLRGVPDAAERFDPWPAMDELVAALDEAAPGWRERGA